MLYLSVSSASVSSVSSPCAGAASSCTVELPFTSTTIGCSNTDIHIEQEETIPAEAYETETPSAEQTIEERLFDITTEDIRDMSTEDFKTYLHDVYKYQSAEFTEEDLAWIGEMSDADIAEAKQIMIDELNNAE